MHFLNITNKQKYIEHNIIFLLINTSGILSECGFLIPQLTPTPTCFLIHDDDDDDSDDDEENGEDDDDSDSDDDDDCSPQSCGGGLELH